MNQGGKSECSVFLTIMIGHHDQSRANQIQIMLSGVLFDVIIWMFEETASLSFRRHCLCTSEVVGSYLFLTYGGNLLGDVASPKEKEPSNEERPFLSIWI